MGNPLPMYLSTMLCMAAIFTTKIILFIAIMYIYFIDHELCNKYSWLAMHGCTLYVTMQAVHIQKWQSISLSN